MCVHLLVSVNTSVPHKRPRVSFTSAEYHQSSHHRIKNLARLYCQGVMLYFEQSLIYQKVTDPSLCF